MLYRWDYKGNNQLGKIIHLNRDVGKIRYLLHNLSLVRDVATPGLRAGVMMYRSKMAGMHDILMRIGNQCSARIQIRVLIFYKFRSESSYTKGSGKNLKFL